MQLAILSLYYVGTLSTVENNFNTSSGMIGMISAASRVMNVIANFALTYYFASKGHRARCPLFALSERTLPYHIFGGGEIYTPSSTANRATTLVFPMGCHFTYFSALSFLDMWKCLLVFG